MVPGCLATKPESLNRGLGARGKNLGACAVDLLHTDYVQGVLSLAGCLGLVRVYRV